MVNRTLICTCPSKSETLPTAQWPGATQFGAHGLVFFVVQEEDGIGAAVGIELSGCNEGLTQRLGDSALLEVTHYGGEQVGIRRR